jgi:two-component system chemotaxis response regulator CheY
MNALVVDDSGTIRIILTKYLEGLGFAVTEATNGLEALHRLKGMGRADVVLVDWNMPEMDGISFVRAVRAEPAYDGLLLMMVSTNCEQSHIAEALAAGANAYVTKPFTRDGIREKLDVLGLPV